MHYNPNESNTYHLSMLLVVTHLTLSVKVKAILKKKKMQSSGSGVMYPIVANMEMRPCFSSV